VAGQLTHYKCGCKGIPMEDGSILMLYCCDGEGPRIIDPVDASKATSFQGPSEPLSLEEMRSLLAGIISLMELGKEFVGFAKLIGEMNER
jgi:hypothetical protein